MPSAVCKKCEKEPFVVSNEETSRTATDSMETLPCQCDVDSSSEGDEPGFIQNDKQICNSASEETMEPVVCSSKGVDTEIFKDNFKDRVGEELENEGAIASEPIFHKISNQFGSILSEKRSTTSETASGEQNGDGAKTQNDNDVILDVAPVPVEASPAPMLGLKLMVDLQKSTFRRSTVKPKSIHKLRLGDIDVLIVLGDSMNTGYRAVDVLQKSSEYILKNLWLNGIGEGVATSVTFGGILKVVNPEVRGLASGVADPYLPGAKETPESPAHNWGYCVAWGGATSEGLLSQAQLVVERMRDKKEKLGDDWVAAVIFVGMNDVGYLAYHTMSKAAVSPKDFKQNVAAALDYMKSHIRKAIVFLVSQPGSQLLLEATSTAKFGQRKGSPKICLARDDYLGWINNALYELQDEYSNDENFAVVVSPFWQDVNTPAQNDDGSVNKEFYSQDVFHPSKWGNSALAIHFTNCLFEPVGKKTKTVSFGKTSAFTLNMPDEEFPYICTPGNSQ